MMLHRIGLVVARDRLEELAALIAGHESAHSVAPLLELLQRAFREQCTRRAKTTAAFDDTKRRALLELLEGEPLREAVGRAPAVVRAAMLRDALLHAERLRTFTRLPAPAPVLDGTRSLLTRAVAALDPSAPPAVEPEPELLAQREEGAAIDLHSFFEIVLQLSRRPGLVTAPHPAVDMLHGPAPGDMRAGWEWTAFGQHPSRAGWQPEELALPRSFDGGRTVVGEAGGPASWAGAGDELSASIDPALAAAARSLASSDALVAFLWLENGVDVPWPERPA